jgi:hypothetical protein
MLHVVFIHFHPFFDHSLMSVSLGLHTFKRSAATEHWAEGRLA